MILIALGANLPSAVGAPCETIKTALLTLDAKIANVQAVSRLYQSPAWPDAKDPPYVNAVALVQTAKPANVLLAELHELEAMFGRVRGDRNAPRTLDLDIIDYDGTVSEPVRSPVLPHPRCAERAFVMAPLIDIAPMWRHPVTGESGKSLLTRLLAGGAVVRPLHDLPR
jgi:2-amino-4-hydroxy-6-hydroxymethyldihydropteridine diphosphokinase